MQQQPVVSNTYHVTSMIKCDIGSRLKVSHKEKFPGRQFDAVFLGVLPANFQLFYNKETNRFVLSQEQSGALWIEDLKVVWREYEVWWWEETQPGTSVSLFDIVNMRKEEIA